MIFFKTTTQYFISSIFFNKNDMATKIKVSQNYQSF
jgi:hypothetical protein